MYKKKIIETKTINVFFPETSKIIFGNIYVDYI